MIKLNCPAFVHKNVVFECILQVESLGTCFNLTIDFSDNEKRKLSFCDGNHSISKSYNSSGLFEIEVSVHNESLNINPNIYVKKVIDYTISPFDYLNNIIEISEYAEYIGCFYASSLSNIFYENSSIQELYNFSHSICFQKCRELDYKFAIIYQGDQCLCSNIYGTEVKLGDQQCKCPCLYNQDSNCGCNFFHLVYRLIDQRVSNNVKGIGLGCHEIINQNITRLIPENTNRACIEFCLNFGKSYNYASTFNKLFCACHTTIDLTEKLPNIDCDLECPGDSSQMCGGYFGPRNVYEIKSSFLELISLNPKTSIVNQNISIRLDLKSINNSSEIEIDFEDNQTYYARTTKFDDQFTIQKSYNLSGKYTIKFKVVDQNLQLEADVNVVETLNLRKPIDKIFIYERGKFMNCASQNNFDFPIDHVNYRKNQEVCSIQCAKNNFAYSSVRSSPKFCFCSNKRPNPISDTNCACACMNSTNRLCGCFGNMRTYEIEKKNEKSQIIGLYHGCFSENFFEKKDNQAFGFLTNTICIQWCHGKGYSYSATRHNNLCFCLDNLEGLEKIHDAYCDLKCNGDRSEYCGSYSSSNVYELMTMNFYTYCDPLGYKFEKVNCSFLLNLTASYPDTVQSLMIDFGDKEIRFLKLNLNQTLNLTKIYNETGNFTIRAHLLNSSLIALLKVQIKRRSIEVDPYSQYQGCFYDRLPFDMDQVIYYNPINMSNKICQDVCRFFQYNFSSTYNGNTCSCGNLFGSYNRAASETNCNYTCSGNNEKCGGASYRSYSVFNADTDSVFYGELKECTSSDLNQKSKVSEVPSNCLKKCESLKLSRQHVNKNSCFCTNSSYEINGLDSSNAFCDLNPTNKIGGSDYYLKSVYRVSEEKITIQRNNFYLKHLGCFALKQKEFDFNISYILFSEKSIFKCWIHCNFMNTQYVASIGSKCLCLINIYELLSNFSSLENCGSESHVDRHFNGNQQNKIVDVYESISIKACYFV
ncbi:unnamed protein product [Brachionus calyciflorus]|uniref:WSC domain-containing protein n=1 Tax=Brachionus calyciflorus TaxID=104777 RepID=A0A813XHA7_9BILA|nr:unnamed protein product [Brachionus calyciflorus]